MQIDESPRDNQHIQQLKEQRQYLTLVKSLLIERYIWWREKISSSLRVNLLLAVIASQVESFLSILRGVLHISNKAIASSLLFLRLIFSTEFVILRISVRESVQALEKREEQRERIKKKREAIKVCTILVTVSKLYVWESTTLPNESTCSRLNCSQVFLVRHFFFLFTLFVKWLNVQVNRGRRRRETLSLEVTELLLYLNKLVNRLADDEAV